MRQGRVVGIHTDADLIHTGTVRLYGDGIAGHPVVIINKLVLNDFLDVQIALYI